MTHPLLPFSLPHTPLALAPMAGITDNPTPPRGNGAQIGP